MSPTQLGEFLTGLRMKRCVTIDDCLQTLETGEWDHVWCRQTVVGRTINFRLADIVSDFESEVPFTIEIGGIRYETNRIPVIRCSFHEPMAILETEGEFSFTLHFLSMPLRRKLCQIGEGGVVDGEVLYDRGMAGRAFVIYRTSVREE